MKILTLSYYPTIKKPFENIFIHEQVKEIAIHQEVKVVNPISILPPFFIFRRNSNFLKNYRRWLDSITGIDSLTTLDKVVVCQPKILPPPKQPRRYMHHREGYFFWILLKKQLKNIWLKWNWDLIHAHMISPHGIIAKYASSYFKTPYIVSCLGSDVLVFLKDEKLKRVSKPVLSNAQAIISKSLELKMCIVNLGIDSKKVYEIWNGVDIFLFHPNNRNPKPKITLKKSKRLLYVGHFYKVKGVEYLLEALSILVNEMKINVGLGLIGHGELRESYERIILKHFLEDSVTFYGPKLHKEIPKYINVHDLVVLSSESEGMPNIIMEALSCGKPIISTDVGGVREIVRPFCGIIVKPKDPKALAIGIKDALKRDWDYRRIRTYASKILDKTKQVRKIINIYNDILKAGQ